MNLAELKTSFYDYVDDEVQDQYEEPQAARLINTALRIVARKLDGQDEAYFVTCKDYSVITTTNVDHVFDLPTDFKRVKLLERLNGSDRPTAVVWTPFEQRHNTPTWPVNQIKNTAAPLCFLFGNKFGVVTPAADYDLRLWYYHTIAELVKNDDAPNEIPGDHHDTIALQAAKIATAGIEGKTFGLSQELSDGMADLTTLTHGRNRQQGRTVHYVG